MAFHARDGWYFERAEDGAVHLVSPSNDIVLDADTWCSAVASVTATGETGDTFRAAQVLHGQVDFGNFWNDASHPSPSDPPT